MLCSSNYLPHGVKYWKPLLVKYETVDLQFLFQSESLRCDDEVVLVNETSIPKVNLSCHLVIFYLLNALAVSEYAVLAFFIVFIGSFVILFLIVVFLLTFLTINLLL